MQKILGRGVFINNILSWQKTKDLRQSVLGPFCEVCGRKRYLIGHHINGKLRSNNVYCDGKGGVLEEIIYFLYSWRSCQLRCNRCEENLHDNYPGGNNSKTKRIRETNNKIIELVLIARKARQFGQDPQPQIAV